MKYQNDDPAVLPLDFLYEKETGMVVQIGFEVRKRVYTKIDVTEEQLCRLKNRDNPFTVELYKDALENGYEETDYSVNDLEGNEIVLWR